MLLIAITLGFAMARLGGEDRARQLTDAGDALLGAVARAAEAAIISGRPRALETDRDRYRVLEWRDGQWAQAGDGGLADDTRLPDGFRFDTLSVADRGGSPAVILDSSGEIIMQDVVIVDQSNANSVIVSLGPDGQLRSVLLSDD